MKRWIFLTAVSFLYLGQPLFAEELNEQGALTRTWNAAETMRDVWSTRWVGFAENIDHYLSGSPDEPVSPEDNRSYLKLQLRQSFLKVGEQQSDVRLRAKVDLPNTEQRLKLFFSSDPDSESDVSERSSSLSSGERVRRDGSVAGLELAPQSP
ncbi:hypothetical protein IB286_02655 [Spongiibacter sp. KMU-158]|uniref:Uncharacterized protein n=1 Tax=Spongiibacter pelagi TaxID=2760804 RepID=A0A927C0Z9_9GAMM|nr:hypothetical protein [Spongiibacter pelagi]MBD2857892.1 hypothetical protein [Spongiibacter pelagi]